MTFVEWWKSTQGNFTTMRKADYNVAKDAWEAALEEQFFRVYDN